MSRVNSYKANYRQHSVDTGNYIKDKHNMKTTATLKYALFRMYYKSVYKITRTYCK
jgi:hypothetical protein